MFLTHIALVCASTPDVWAALSQIWVGCGPQGAMMRCPCRVPCLAEQDRQLLVILAREL